MKERFLTTSCAFVSFIPSYCWYGRRLLSGGEELLSALLIPATLMLSRGRTQLNDERWWLTAIGISLYVGCWLLSVPAIIKASVAITVLLYYFDLSRYFGISALAYLSLPWLSSLQFYLGYPLRRVVGEVSELILTGVGLPVMAVGTGLLFQNQYVHIDPPCSGVRMLWIGTLFCVFLCAVYRLCWRKGAAMISLTAGLLILANSLRGSVLFFPESGLVQWPEWTHEGVGVVIYFLCILILLSCCQKLSSPHD